MAMHHFASLWFAAGAAATLIGGAALVCSGRTCTPAAWDLRVLDWFATHRTPGLDAVFLTVTWLGSLWLLLPLALALIAGLAARGRIATAASIAAAFGGAVLMSYAAKLWIGRERPPALDALVAMPADASFPSGHAMQITAFALALAWMLAPPSQRGFWLAFALASILLVGVSRVYLQVHFPSDVVAGTLAAALWTGAIAAKHCKQASNPSA
jgi:undecaprenyl-diphosphatase